SELRLSGVVILGGGDYVVVKLPALRSHQQRVARKHNFQVSWLCLNLRAHRPCETENKLRAISLSEFECEANAAIAHEKASRLSAISHGLVQQLFQQRLHARQWHQYTAIVDQRLPREL